MSEEIVKQMGDLKVIYKHGSIFVYKNSEEIDKFNPKYYLNEKIIKNPEDLKKIADKRFEETDDYRSPLGKDVTSKIGVINPKFKVYKLGGKYRLYSDKGEEKGKEIGESHHKIDQIIPDALEYQRTVEKEEKQNISQGQSNENQNIIENNKKDTAKTLFDRLNDRKNLQRIENDIRFPKPQQADADSPPQSFRQDLANRVGKDPEKGGVTMDQFRELDNKFRGEKAAEDFEQMVKGKQEERRQTLDRFDTRAEKNDSLLDKLDSYGKDVSEELTDFKQLGKDQSQKMQSLMPGDDFNLDWGVKPTFENAKKVWDEQFAPNYKFSSDKPFNQKAHELGLAGHAPGSSSVDSNQREKMGARTREELENMAMIQEMLLKQQGSRGVDISDIQSLGKGAMGYQQQGLDAQSNIMNPIFNQQQRAQEQGDDLARMRSEADTTLSNKEIQENAQLYDFLEAQRQQEMQDIQGMQQLDFDTNMAMIANEETARVLKNEANLQETQTWAQREQIYDMLKRTGLAEKEFALKEAEKRGDNKAWANLIQSVFETAGTVVGSIYGGPAGGAAGGAIVKIMSDLFKDGSTKSTYEAGGKET